MPGGRPRRTSPRCAPRPKWRWLMAPGRSVGATTRAEKLLAPLDASGSVHHTWGRRSSWELSGWCSAAKFDAGGAPG